MSTLIDIICALIALVCSVVWGRLYLRQGGAWKLAMSAVCFLLMLIITYAITT
jgi:hypothetical protein